MVGPPACLGDSIDHPAAGSVVVQGLDILAALHPGHRLESPGGDVEEINPAMICHHKAVLPRTRKLMATCSGQLPDFLQHQRRPVALPILKAVHPQFLVAQGEQARIFLRPHGPVTAVKRILPYAYVRFSDVVDLKAVSLRIRGVRNGNPATGKHIRGMGHRSVGVEQAFACRDVQQHRTPG